MCLVLTLWADNHVNLFLCQRHFIFIFGSETPLYPFSSWSHIVNFYTTWCHGCLFWPFLISQPAIFRGLDITLLFSSIKVRFNRALVVLCARVSVCVCVCGVRMVGSGSTPYTLSTYTARVHTANCIDEWGGLDLFFICLMYRVHSLIISKTQATVFEMSSLQFWNQLGWFYWHCFAIHVMADFTSPPL